MKILIFGDICPTPDFRQQFDSTPEKLFNDIIPLIKKSDLVVCNFECPATDSEEKAIKTGPNLKAEVKDINFLKESGFNIFSLANNHILDYGQEGVYSTINTLENAQLKFVGGGINQSQAKKALYIEVDNKKIGFLSFAEHEFNIATENTAGANLFDPYISLKSISDCKKSCDYLVVLYHGGIEHYEYPTPLLQKKCRSMVEHGANVVLCQHSHCIGTQELYNDSTILYGQGNAVFGYREHDSKWNEGLIVELSIEEQLSIKYHLIRITKEGIHLNDDKKRLQHFFINSEKLSDQNFLQNSFTTFCNKRKALDLPLFYGKSIHTIRLNRLLKGKLFKPKKKNVMITHNLIRCDAWNEVIQEILRGEFHDK